MSEGFKPPFANNISNIILNLPAGKTGRNMHYHTVIIGGGPGGLSCATKLAQMGLAPLVIERNPRPGPKVCAGGIPWSGLGRHLPAELAEKHFLHQHISSQWQKIIVKNDTPIITTINREKLGQWMRQEAEKSGVKIISDCPVLRIEEDTVFTRKQEFTFNFLVGADGSNSLVRRFLNIPTRQIGAGIQYQVPGDYPNMEWHLNQRLFASGYAWIFPHKKGASIGAYVNRKDMPAARLKKNLDHWLQKNGIKVNGLALEAATINFDHQGYHFGNKFLVGDAAGLASGLTGEGIYPAIVSGKTVATLINDPDYQCHDLNRIIGKQQRHNRLLHLSGSNRFICRVIMESLLAGLRTGIVNFKSLELA